VGVEEKLAAVSLNVHVLAAKRSNAAARFELCEVLLKTDLNVLRKNKWNGTLHFIFHYSNFLPDASNVAVMVKCNLKFQAPQVNYPRWPQNDQRIATQSGFKTYLCNPCLNGEHCHIYILFPTLSFDKIKTGMFDEHQIRTLEYHTWKSWMTRMEYWGYMLWQFNKIISVIERVR